MKLRHKLLICLSFLMALDVASTLLGLHVGAKEGNPLIAPLLGVGAAWLVMLAIKALAVFVIHSCQRPLSDRWSHATLAGCNLLMAVVVAWNLAVIA